MFDGQKYMTRGVNEEVPMLAVITMWTMIETARGKTELDYLQVFKLKPETVDGGPVQVIDHHQEVPPFSQTIAFPLENPITATIFVIDDGPHSTMTTPEER